MKKTYLLLIFSLLLIVFSGNAQSNPDEDDLVLRSKISFDDLVEYDQTYPSLIPAGRRVKNSFKPPYQWPIDPNEIVYQAPKIDLAGSGAVKEPSPEPEIDFQGLDDNGNSIPPDVNGAVGPDHIMVTLNTQTRIMDKEGNPISTIGTGAFWQGVIGAGGVFDPKIYYDPYDERWIYTMPSSSDPQFTRIMVAVSESSDPTGNWYRYSFDCDPDDEYWFDYPDLGFNKKWIVVTGNMSQAGPDHSVVFVFNKEDLYNFAYEINYSRIIPGDGLSLIPAATFDEDEEDIYMVNHAGGNVDGYGYLKLRKITGDVNNPIIEDIGLSGIPSPWHEWGYFDYGDFAPQLGSEEKLNTVDARFQNMVFRDNKLWCVHHIYLPADDPTRSAIQFWQLDTEGTILQWARVDGEEDGMFYAFPSIAVNAVEDVMIGYVSMSEEQYASSSYAVRFKDDPLNTLRDSYQYKDGLAPYYKTFGGNRNRWGDYSSTCVDPVNDLDFWTLQEYAELPSGSDLWGVWWAKVNAEAAPDADFISNIVSVPVGSGADFSDISRFEPSQWEWKFEGGNPETSNEQHPNNIVYEESGTFDVTLIVSNNIGSDTLIQEDYIDANTNILPEIHFAVSDTIPCLSDTLVFEDMTIYNPMSWHWEFIPNYVSFVNGTDEFSQNPQVVFDYPFSYDVKLTTENNNGASSLTSEDMIKAGGEIPTYMENFESWYLDRTGWTVENPDDDITWEITMAGGSEPGTLAAYVNIKNYDGLGERDRLISPPLNFYQHKELVLSFQFAYSQRLAQYTDSLIVYLSPDCGLSWQRLLAMGEDGSGSFATGGPMMNNFVPETAADWCGADGNPACVELDLSAWSGQSNIQLMFESYNGYGNNLYIDNLRVEGNLIRVNENDGWSNALEIFPNPASGIVSIQTGEHRSHGEIRVYDLKGTCILIEEQRANQSGLIQLDMRAFEDGIYFIHCIAGDSVQTGKLIKK